MKLPSSAIGRKSRRAACYPKLRTITEGLEVARSIQRAAAIPPSEFLWKRVGLVLSVGFSVTFYVGDLFRRLVWTSPRDWFRRAGPPRSLLLRI